MTVQVEISSAWTDSEGDKTKQQPLGPHISVDREETKKSTQQTQCNFYGKGRVPKMKNPESRGWS